jgi:hypothetical protein
MRSLVAMKSRSIRLAVLFIVLSLGIGFALAGRGPGWLVVIASIAGTLAMFTLNGIRLRLVLLGGTMLWLTNDLLSRSVGGTMLETLIAVVNLSTIVRMARSSDRRPPIGLAAEAD